MKATIDWIRKLNRERADKVKPLYLELDAIIRDDSKPGRSPAAPGARAPG